MMSKAMSGKQNHVQRWHVIILAALAALLYANTLTNDYALDDGLVITENPYTRQGLSGIPDILTHDAYQWYYEEKGSAGELSGGRYRPLSIITFAVEYEFFGANPAVSHFINLLLYLFTGILIYLLIARYWMPKKEGMAFLTAFLFLLHPVHTEAVANIKSRDELLAFFLVLASLYLLFSYLKEKKKKTLIFSSLLFFLALLSKESSITFLAIIPLSLYFFGPVSVKETIKPSTPFFIAAGLWLGIRYAVIGGGGATPDDIMNDPFLYATAGEKIGTAFYILLKYMGLLLWPHPLVYDYGFAQIAYRQLSDPMVILSIFLHAGLLLAVIAGWRKRRIASFAAAWYLASISIVSNLIVPLGGTMGERLLYMPSFAFALIAAHFIYSLYQKIPQRYARAAAILFLSALTLACGNLIIQRNRDWKNNESLFVHDVQYAPRSIKANTAAAGEYLNKYLKEENPEYLQKALEYYDAAESLYPVRQDSFKRALFLYNNYINRAYIYFTIDSLQKAEEFWERAKAIKPFHPKVKEYGKALALAYYKKANEAAATDLERAIELYYHSVKLDPTNSEVWYNLGGALYTRGRYSEAEKAFAEALKLDPKNEKARQGLAAARFQLNQLK